MSDAGAVRRLWKRPALPMRSADIALAAAPAADAPTPDDVSPVHAIRLLTDRERGRPVLKPSEQVHSRHWAVGYGALAWLTDLPSTVVGGQGELRSCRSHDIWWRAWMDQVVEPPAEATGRW